MAWISLDKVRLSRGGRVVLHDLSAELGGTAIGLVGANGAGKTTLIGALLGVLRPDSGDIRVLEHRLPADAQAVRAQTGVMAEQAGIFPGGSGVDALAFAGSLSGLGRQQALRRAHRALDALGVGEERYRPTAGYSTGMRQKCKLGMALVHDPPMLILDEPTVGLDPTARAQLLSLIRELRDDGRKILLSTHIMRDAETVCDQLLLLEGGTTAFCGPKEALLGERSEALTARGRGIDERLVERLEAVGVEVISSSPESITFPGTDEALERFWETAAALPDVAIYHLGTEVRSLEDAVVSAMNEAAARQGGDSDS